MQFPNINLLPSEGKQYKANLHAHTTNSDGALTPQEMKSLYARHGYSILAYTDHNVLNYFKELSDQNFLVLCGYEVDVYTQKSSIGVEKTCHLNAIARNPACAVLVERPAEYTPECVNETIEKLRSHDFIVNYNHPSWSSEEPDDYLSLKGLSGMEIYNHGCEVLTNDGDARAHYDMMLQRGMKLFCLATDDNHNHDTLDDTANNCTDSCGGFVMVKTSSLTYDNVIAALDKGDFYCSTGPLIDELYIKDNKLYATCSPASGIYLKADTIGALFYAISDKNDITHAVFDLSEIKKDISYIRLEIATVEGKMAFSNPFFL